MAGLAPSRGVTLTASILSRPDHYTCKICDQKGHWIQDCPEKEARDAERDAERAARGEPVGMRANAGGAREPIRPIQRK